MIDLVADLLAAAGIVRPPVRIPTVTGFLGITVQATTRLPEGWEAMLLRGRRHSLCNYSPLPPIQRRRFSIAHEIGHFLLHEGRGFVFDEREPHPHDEEAMEKEADAFAAELLMPTQWVLDACLVNPSFDDLRHRFWVSRQAMRRRLQTLGLFISVTTRDVPTFTDWSVLERDAALDLYERSKTFHPAEIYASATGDPYEDYLIMRGVLERGVRHLKSGWDAQVTDSAATAPVVLIRP